MKFKKWPFDSPTEAEIRRGIEDANKKVKDWERKRMLKAPPTIEEIIFRKNKLK